MGIKITDLTALATAPNTADVIVIVDVSDTTQALSGTTKKITIADLGFLSSGDNITELTNNAGYITSSDFSNGGELAGADRDLGNTDAFALSFITNGVGRINIEAGGNVGIGTTTPTEKLEVVGNTKISANLGIGTATTLGTYFEIDNGVANKAVKFTDLGTGIGLQFKRSSDTYLGEIYPDEISTDQVLRYNSRSGHRFDYNGTQVVEMNSVSNNGRLYVNNPTSTSGTLSVESKVQGITGASVYALNSASNTTSSENRAVWGEANGTGGTTTTNVGGYFTASGGTTANYAIKSNGNINMANLPTSSAGLSAGDLWNNAGVINIV